MADSHLQKAKEWARNPLVHVQEGLDRRFSTSILQDMLNRTTQRPPETFRDKILRKYFDRSRAYSSFLDVGSSCEDSDDDDLWNRNQDDGSNPESSEEYDSDWIEEDVGSFGITELFTEGENYTNDAQKTSQSSVKDSKTQNESTGELASSLIDPNDDLEIRDESNKNSRHGFCKDDQFSPADFGVSNSPSEHKNDSVIKEIEDTHLKFDFDKQADANLKSDSIQDDPLDTENLQNDSKNITEHRSQSRKRKSEKGPPPLNLVMSNLFKGMLFVQEMYEVSSIDYFYEKYPDKYKMLFGRGSEEDQIIFQGSSSEGLGVYKIKECDEDTY